MPAPSLAAGRRGRGLVRRRGGVRHEPPARVEALHLLLAIERLGDEDRAARSAAELRDGMRKAGMPPLLVEAIVEIGGSVRSGKASEVLPTVEQVLGRKPLTWTDWARENAAAFR